MDIKEKVTEVKEKIEEGIKSGKIEETAAGLKDKVQEVLDKTDIDEKVVEKVGEVKEKIEEKFKK